MLVLKYIEYTENFAKNIFFPKILCSTKRRPSIFCINEHKLLRSICLNVHKFTKEVSFINYSYFFMSNFFQDKSAISSSKSFNDNWIYYDWAMRKHGTSCPRPQQ